jgi:hypothetical protein
MGNSFSPIQLAARESLFRTGSAVHWGRRNSFHRCGAQSEPSLSADAPGALFGRIPGIFYSGLRAQKCPNRKFVVYFQRAGKRKFWLAVDLAGDHANAAIV